MFNASIPTHIRTSAFRRTWTWNKSWRTDNLPSRHRLTSCLSPRRLAAVAVITDLGSDLGVVHGRLENNSLLYRKVGSMPVQYWLMKTEPGTYSIDDLARESDLTTCWEGVRNYQARNILRDDIQEGDCVLFYHSACKEPAVVGTAIVTRGGYPDKFAFDQRSKYYDKKSDPDDPTWYMVDVKLDQKFDQPVTLKEMRAQASLEGMVLLQKGSRLSVQPVKKKEFNAVLKMAKVKK